MTKLRDPDSIEGAGDRVAGVIGYRGMEEALRTSGRPRSEAFLRQCFDGDKDSHIQARDMLVLDAACQAAGGGTPFTDFFQRHLTALNVDASDVDPSTGAMRLSAETGEVNRAIADAASPDGPGGEQYTIQEINRITSELADVDRQSAQLRNTLEALKGRHFSNVRSLAG